MKKFIFLLALFCGISTSTAFSQCDTFDDSVLVSDPSCHGFNDGLITAYAFGGTETYIYSIKDSLGDVVNIGGSSMANLLPGGWYYITITDNLGCVIEDSVFLEDLAAIVVDTTMVNESSPGACDGSITVDTVYNYHGSFATLSFMWSTGPPNTAEKTSLCSGDYFLVITDSNSCSATLNFHVGSEGTDSTTNVSDYLPSESAVFVSGNTLNAKFTGSSQNVMLTLFDLSGKLIFCRKIESGMNNINVNLENGVYLYQISSDGRTIQKGKIGW